MRPLTLVALGTFGKSKLLVSDANVRRWHFATEAKPLSLRSLLGVLRTLLMDTLDAIDPEPT